MADLAQELQTDVRRRIGLLKEAMLANDLAATLVVAQGAPGSNGMLRYFTNVELWSNRAFALITRQEEDPLVILKSNYGAQWAKQMATTPRIVSTGQENRPPIARVVEELRQLVKPGQTVGVLNMRSTLSIDEHQTLIQACPGVTFKDFTPEVNRIRQIKSDFEIRAMEETARIMAGALDAFADAARLGRLAWEAAAEAERYAKARGCFWGRSKFSLDQLPFTIPAPVDRRFKKDDVILFELVYAGPLGYWIEITCVYSFGPLPDAASKRLAATEKVVASAAALAKPGTRFGEITKAADETFRQMGFKVIGKHTPDCHTIGTDECDGVNPPPTDEQLRDRMVLSFHPASLLEGGFAFLISDNYLVTPQGGKPLSPRGRPYRQLSV